MERTLETSAGGGSGDVRFRCRLKGSEMLRPGGTRGGREEEEITAIQREDRNNGCR